MMMRAKPRLGAGKLAKSIAITAMILTGVLGGCEGDDGTSGGINWAAVQSLWQENLVFLAFGDSLTYGVGSSSGGPATGYPKLLEAKLKQHYTGYFSSINKGIGGEGTSPGLERFARVLDETNPNLVLLMEGANDLNDLSAGGPTFDEIETNLRNMIQIALNRGIPVIIATIPPQITNQYRERSVQMAKVVAFNPRIYAIAADFNIPVARVFEAITAVPNWESKLMDHDAIHLNDAGYHVVRNAFYEVISAILTTGQY